MRRIYLMAQVDKNLCIGDKICENICVSKAIKVIDKKAGVDENKCVLCMKCFDACPKAAISIVSRVEPLVLAVNTAEVDQNKLKEICARAHLDPEEKICACTSTTAKEAAAAILKGAKSPEEVTLMTGLRSACSLWCIAPILRLLKAYDIELPPSDGYRWYNISPALWNVSEDVARKYPEYRIGEDKKLLQEGVFHNFIKL